MRAREHTSAPVSTISVAATLMILVAVSVTVVPGAHADSVTLGASKDGTLYSEDSGLANGAGIWFFAGRTFGQMGTEVRRAILDFDIPLGTGPSEIPPGSSIDAVRITVTADRSPNTLPELFGLHVVRTEWSEGGANAPGNEGQGATATAGDVTWGFANFNTVAWQTPGGDFESAADATVTIGEIGAYTFTSAAMAQSVQDFLDGSSELEGWMIVIQNESTTGTARRFKSRTGGDGFPQMVIEYTRPVPNAETSIGSVKSRFGER